MCDLCIELSRFKKAVAQADLILPPFIAVRMLHSISVTTPESLDFSPFSDLLSYQDIPLSCLNKRALKQLFKDAVALPVPSSLPAIPPSRWKLFLSTPMDGATRTLWYRLIHDKISSKNSLYRLLPDVTGDDRCHYCSNTETPCHMLFTCGIKSHVWYRAFSRYIGSPNRVLLSVLFEDFRLLSFPLYTISDYSIKLHIYQLMGIFVFSIWSAHWREHFSAIPFLPDRVFCTILKKVHSLNQHTR